MSRQSEEIVVADPDPRLREMLERECDRMTDKIEFRMDNRDRIARHIEALRRVEKAAGQQRRGPSVPIRLVEETPDTFV